MSFTQVHPDGAREEDGVLRDDGDARAQPGQPEQPDVLAVDVDGAADGLDDAEERQRQRRLSRARPTARSSLSIEKLPSLVVEGHQGPMISNLR